MFFIFELLSILVLRRTVTSNKRLENWAKKRCQKALLAQYRDRNSVQYETVTVAAAFCSDILSEVPSNTALQVALDGGDDF
jgi:hypothetical protein